MAKFKLYGACAICGKPRGGRGHAECSRELQAGAKPARRSRNNMTTTERMARFLVLHNL